MSNPFISVMIPHYNRVAYLQKTLESVLAQVTEDLQMEITVLDDCSDTELPDQTVYRFNHPQVKLIKNEKNLGQMGNINKCIDLARGTWIHILHSDDLVLPGFYQAVRSTAAQFGHAGAIFTRHQFIDDRGKVLYLSAALSQVTGTIPGWFEKIAKQQQIQTPSIVVKKSVYQDVGKFDSGFVMCEDWEMWVRISRKYDVVFIPEVLAAYRETAVSTTSEAFKNGQAIRDHHRAIQIIKTYHQSDQLERDSRQKAGHYLYIKIQDLLYSNRISFKELWKWQMDMFKCQFMNTKMIINTTELWAKWMMWIVKRMIKKDNNS